MHHARSTLNKIFAQALRREGGDNTPMLAWPVACGSAVAGKTTAVRFADGVLTVQVPDAGWQQQMRILTQQYVAALNRISPHRVLQVDFILAGEHQPGIN
jgi:hypothetical protein